MPDHFDEEERVIREMLVMLQNDYRKAAEPYLKRLAAIQYLRPMPAMLIQLDENMNPRFDIIDLIDGNPHTPASGDTQGEKEGK